MINESVTTINAFLSFKLGEELFAANVGKVLEILEMTKITKVPKAPEYMRGVINLRGNVLPVIDARLKFGMKQIENTIDTCIIVLDIDMEGDAVKVGILVDSVQEVLQLDEASIQPPPSIGSRYKSEFILGMGKLDNEFVMILNIDKVFSTDELWMIQEKSPTEVKEEVLVEKKVSIRKNKKQ